MNPDYTSSKQIKSNPVDRLSALPVDLLHDILSFLPSKEACQTRILSKRWGLVSATSPFLHFHYEDFIAGAPAGDKMSKLRYSRKRMMEYVYTTMQRYSRERLPIKKFTLELPADIDEDMLGCNVACKLDDCLKIAVDNEVVELKLHTRVQYKVPTILFAAKKLKRLDCSGLVLHFYEAMDLASLENLHLGSSVYIEDAMLNHIISSCRLLKTLKLSGCCGIDNMVIPASSKLETLDLEDLYPMKKLSVETSSLARFKYFPKGYDHRMRYDIADECWDCWPVTSKASLLQNLRILEINRSKITDKVANELLFELTLLETLKFRNCYNLTTIKVSSTRLKEINLDQCDDLLYIEINAPNLRILEINSSKITDKVADELLSQLTLLETLKIRNCYNLTTIKVSSTRLKEVNLDGCYDLLYIEIDAPSLRNFRYHGYFKPSLSFAVNSRANCDVSLRLLRPHPPVDIGNGEFLVLKKLLTGIRSCNVLEILMFNVFNSQCEDGTLGFQFDEEELNNIHPGPPCYVRELKLELHLYRWRYLESSITAFLDGLFWNCHPDVISLYSAFEPSKEAIKSMICELKRMAESRSHPLKRVEAEGAYCSKLPDGGQFDEQLRLHW